jgi:TonB family protein
VSNACAPRVALEHDAALSYNKAHRDEPAVDGGSGNDFSHLIGMSAGAECHNRRTLRFFVNPRSRIVALWVFGTTTEAARAMNSTPHTAEVLPPRAMLFLGIVALHAVLAYFFAQAFLETTISIIRVNRIQAIDLPVEQKPPPVQQVPVEQPTIPQPTLSEVPKPDWEIVMPADPETVMASATFEPVPVRPAEPLIATEPPVRLIGRHVMPNTEDYYPAHERRLGIEGATAVRACVDTDGKLSGAPTVESSSGRESFDRAAVRVARDGRYARAVRGETPVSNCYGFRVIFSMH